MSDDFFTRVGTAAPNGGPGNAPPAATGLGLNVEIHPQSAPGLMGPGAIAARRWAQCDDIFWPASETCERLAPGFYAFTALPNIGACLRRTAIAADSLIELPDTAGADVLDEFAAFWGMKERFADRGFLHKRGILLWGPPGSGKTASLMLMSRDIVQKHGGIVCQIDEPSLAAMCLSLIRKIEPERPIVALIEDLDSLVQRFGESGYLALLDGETQVDNIVYIATTNYPERLDRRFVDRPSRFDTVRWIGMPSAAAREAYLRVKEPSIGPDELARWVDETDGFSVAHLRELVILVKCFGRPLEAAIARLESMRLRKPTSEDAPDKPRFGFGVAA